ncbi:MAG: SET domain-containing protein-lysine N-methyltransferase [Gammaproteobacteria bacterium]|nr:SET domain-containing protein-lysine N-methyltransferase [Gammaproteobacteria bacterium]
MGAPACDLHRYTPHLASLQRCPLIYYQSSAGKGRGVFAGRQFEAEELIERVPVIVFPAAECAVLEKTLVDAYDFTWETEETQTALALGYGSLYNHSFEPNARYVRLFESEEIEFTALRRIEKDEEILINYNGGDLRSRLVFEESRWHREDC